MRRDMTEIWEDVENMFGETFIVSELTSLWLCRLFDMILKKKIEMKIFLYVIVEYLKNLTLNFEKKKS